LKSRKEHFIDLGFRERPLFLSKGGSKENSQPGQFPYQRGIHKNMYRGKLWTMRQFAGFGLAKDTNRRFRYLLRQGQTGLSTAFDMPALMGYDPDHEMARGEVGREGVSLSHVTDMERLFDKIALDQVSVSMTINCTASIAFAMYLVAARRRGFNHKHLAGTIQNDMLKEFIAQKEWISPPAPSLKMTCDLIEFCAKQGMIFNPISISGYHIREAGSTAAQELGLTLANGVAYVEELLSRELKIDQFASRLSFFFDIHNDFLEEVSKLRAARSLWAKLIKHRFKSTNQRSQMLRMHAQTAGVSLTSQQPLNNVIRVALQALAGVLGGVQSLHTNSMDETLSLPTERAVTVALRTQQIIAEESGVADTVDPLAGAYFIEDLCAKLEREGEEIIKEIDRNGGALKAIDKGVPQKMIAESAYRYQLEIEREERKIVGVNCYQEDEEQSLPLHQVDEKGERQAIRSLKTHRRTRNRKAWRSSLQKLEKDARRKVNLLPSLIEAVDCGATLGEISQLYRDVFGVYRDPGIY
jgi:methylmalonyl-CoA mutase N-terminal domain/subunit